MDFTEITERKTIITGGSKGIGKAAVKVFLERGAVVASLSRSKGNDAEELKEKYAGRYFDYRCDVSDHDMVETAFRQAAADMGGLDVMINCAGIENAAAPEDITPEMLKQMFEIHAYGTVYTNQSAFRLMKDNGGGRIINFSSETAIEETFVNGAHYAAAKGAVLSWSRIVSRAWGKYDIAVNSVCPAIVSDMYQGFLDRMDAEERAAWDKQMKEQVPLRGVLGDAEKDMAPVLVFLASDAARFITGQIFMVNGGTHTTR